MGNTSVRVRPLPPKEILKLRKQDLLVIYQQASECCLVWKAVQELNAGWYMSNNFYCIQRWIVIERGLQPREVIYIYIYM